MVDFLLSLFLSLFLVVEQIQDLGNRGHKAQANANTVT